jgi:transposase-like protein
MSGTLGLTFAGDRDDDVVAPVCPLCHTMDVTVNTESLRRGAWWRCTVCSQSWDATRLETAAAYADFTAAREASRVRATPHAA